MRKTNVAAVLVPTLVVPALLLVVLVSGCGGSTSQPVKSAVTSVPAAAQITTVHIVRTSDNASSHLAPFNYTGHDAAKVQALYTTLLGLPAYTPNGKACPTDSGVQYQFTFSNGGSTTSLQAIADPSGCQVVVINGRDNRTAAHSTLWTFLAESVGVPESQVYPVPTA